MYATAIGAGPVGTGGQVSYPTICEFLANGATREFDPESRVPYAYHKRTWISYDDEQSLKEKVIILLYIQEVYYYTEKGFPYLTDLLLYYLDFRLNFDTYFFS